MRDSNRLGILVFRGGACLLAFLGVMTLSLARAQGSPDQVLPAVRSIVDQWSKDARTFVGPLVSEEIAAQVVQTGFHLCPYEPAACEKFRDALVRRRIIRAYLDDLRRNDATTLSVMERFVNDSKIRLSAFGWPEGPTFNRFAYVVMPGTPRDVSRYVHWNGTQEIAPTATHAIFAVGVHTLIAQTPVSDSEVRVFVQRSRGQATARQLTRRVLPVKGRLAALPSRVDPQFERFCLAKAIDPSEPKYRPVTGRGQPGIARPSDFHAAETVRIRLEGTAQDCDTACRRWLGVQFVQALAEWRAGCARCPQSTLSLVEIGEDKYVLVRFVDWAQFASDHAADKLTASALPEAYGKTVLLVDRSHRPIHGIPARGRGR